MDLKKLFFSELEGKVKQLKKPLTKVMNGEAKVSDIDSIFRTFHTLKGSSGLVGFRNFQKIFHDLEDVVKAWKKGDADPVMAKRICNILDLLQGENDDISPENFDRVRRILKGEVDDAKEVELKVEDDHKIREMIDSLLNSLIELETHIKNNELKNAEIVLNAVKNYLLSVYEDIEYLPMAKVLEGFEALVAKDAVDLGKKVKLEMSVEGAKVLRSDVKLLRDSLIHLVRNAVVHGIESPGERKNLGKDPVGRINIKSWIENEMLVLIVEDDGRGIDFDKVIKKAKELGIEETDPLKIIFYPQFSSLESTNMKGGRGVGLDAVKSYIESRGGSISVHSEKGKGTRFEIKLPIEKYFKKLIIVGRSEKTFALESSEIEEISKNFSILREDEKILVEKDDKVYELKDLGDGEVSFIAFTTNHVAVAIDKIIDIREATIRPSTYNLNFIKGFALGIGSFPIPVVDPSNIKPSVLREEEKARILIVDDSPLTRTVISKTVEKIGYIPLTAINKSEALSIIERETFSYAIVDYNLPDGKGSEIVREIRKRRPGSKIMVLTAETDPYVEEDSKSSGADTVIRKGEAFEKIIEFLEG